LVAGAVLFCPLQGCLDPASSLVALAIDDLGVDPQQDMHAVAGPFGDLCRRDACAQPQRDSRVPEVVGALSLDPPMTLGAERVGE
jgi:hypothetical protein